MNRVTFTDLLATLAVSIALSLTPQSAFARGGGGFHGGGGGFHGGSFGGFHGGGGFGGFHGGGFGGFHHGFGGFRGDYDFGRGFWGYPGWGWGLDIGFGFGPYWGWGYPGYYDYPWYGPYAYPSYYPPYAYGHDYNCPPNYQDRPDYRYPKQNNAPSNSQGPTKPSSESTPNSYPEANYTNRNSVDYRVVMNQRSRPPARVEPEPNINNDSIDLRVVMNRPAPVQKSRSNLQLATFITQAASPQTRPAVRNSIAALRAMPPTARARQLNSGRYDNFTQSERKILNLTLQASQVQ